MTNSLVDRQFQQACQQRELRLQRCDACGNTQFYPRVICSACGSDQLQWITASGRGKVASYTVVRQAVGAQFADRLPYVAALIDLHEGPRMMSVIIDAEPDAVRIGDQVLVDFEPWGGDELQPVFNRGPLKAKVVD